MEGKERKRAIIYIRVSTTEQAKEGLSLDVQRRKAEQYCHLLDMDVVAVCEDAGISGKNFKDRPGIRGALDRLAAGEAEALVVLKLDRLSRSTKDVLNLIEQVDREGWELHSISEHLDTGTAAGRFVLTTLAALSQMEREQIGERTSMALQEKKRRGERLGTTPYGYRTVSLSDGKNELRPEPGVSFRAPGLIFVSKYLRVSHEGILLPIRRCVV